MKNLFLILFLFVGFSASAQFKKNEGRIFNVANYGAIANAKDVTDAGMASNTTVSSATAVFTTADVGKSCIMYGSGAAGINQTGTITAFISATQVTVSFTAAATVTNKEFFYGTECTTGIQAAINAADAALGGKVILPSGVYFLGGALVTSQNTSNPNCQIYIPYHAYSGQFEYSIEIEGESSVNLSSGYFGTPNPTPTTGVVLRSIVTGSGTTPAIIGGGDPTHQVATSVWVKNFNTQAYTNRGTVAPTLSGVWFNNMYKVSGERICAALDVPNQNSADPSATETCGISISFLSNAGPNVWKECSAMGYKYGIISNEHTVFDNNYVFSCVYAYVFTSSMFSVTGYALYHACQNGVYFPNVTTMGVAAGHTRVFDLRMECELDSGATVGGYWYSTFVSNINDPGNNGFGIIKTLNLLGNTTPASSPIPIVVVGGSNLTSLAYNVNYVPTTSTLAQVLASGSTSTAGQQVTLDGFNTTDRQLIIGGTGGLGMQSYSLDNGFWHNNIKYNSGYKYIGAGAGETINAGGGAYFFNGFPSGSAGAAATPTYIHGFYAAGNAVFNAAVTGDNSTAQVQSVSTSQPQFAAHYNATNYGTLQTGSTGTMTITTAGTAGDLTLAPLRNLLLSPTSGAITQSKNTNGLASYNISNTTAGASSGAYSRVTSSTYLTQLLQYSSSTTPFGAFVANAGGIYSTSTNLVLGADNAAGNIDFGIGTTIPKVYTMNATSFNPAVASTNDLGTGVLYWRQVFMSHPVGETAIGVSSSLGTNVTSVTPSGNDAFFNLTVVTSATATGTIGLVAFGTAWGATPKCVISAANAVTGAMIASAGGYVGLDATSTTSMTLAGLFTGAGTWKFNCHCGQ